MRSYAQQKTVKIRPLKLKDFVNYYSNQEDGLAVDFGSTKSRNLVVFPAQCNFTGYRPPLEIIETIQKYSDGKSKNFVCLDAAAYLSTSRLDLRRYKPDYVSVSFYKIFGYPTGLGCLLVRKRAEEVLKKDYYGGGTVFVAAGSENFHIPRTRIEERFEDGTLPYLEIVSLNACFDWLEASDGDKTFKIPFELASYTFKKMDKSRHDNGLGLFEVYSLTDYSSPDSQGGIISFNMKAPDNSYIGYAEVENIASANNFCVRTGCFCNPGACQSFLNLSKEDLIKHFEAGHVCGDSNDLIDGYPTGAVRLSFSYHNTVEEIDAFIDLLVDTFKDRCPNGMLTASLPSDLQRCKVMLKKIRLYPVKSCSYQEVECWSICDTGLVFDREWMVTTANGASVTQKREPRLCLLKPTVDLQTRVLVLAYPGLSPIQIPIDDKKGHCSEIEMCKTRICGDQVSVQDCGDEASDWLKQAFGAQGYRLVRKMAVRNSKLEPGVAHLSLANESQYLLVNEASVLSLMKEIEKTDGSSSVSLDEMIDRFRGNLIISGLDPFLEEELDSFQVSGITFKALGACSRCQMICVNQTTSERSQEPLTTLARLRGRKMPFGVHVTAKIEESAYVELKISRLNA